ncbi:effector binding domain-containing protein [Glaesserella sp.]|uniref:effector binding domain-containing protein n=1 Tax=Glaesserella sp. TaxID=2094731 RepID=UPI0035A1032F
MALQLYPLDFIRTHNFNENAGEKICSLLQRNVKRLPQNEPCYVVYDNYESDFNGNYQVSLALESNPTGNTAIIEIEDLAWYEVFPTTRECILQTWRQIWNKEKQGLLKRAYQTDFEKYYPDGNVEIYISLHPHC